MDGALVGAGSPWPPLGIIEKRTTSFTKSIRPIINAFKYIFIKILDLVHHVRHSLQVHQKKLAQMLGKYVHFNKPNGHWYEGKNMSIQMFFK